MRIRAIALAAAGTAVLGLAACSGGNSGTPASTGKSSGGSDHSGTTSVAATLEQAYGSTVDAKTAKISMTTKETTAGKTTTFTGEGEAQFKPLAEQMTMHSNGQDIQTILVDGTSYTKVPGSGWQKTNVGSTGSSQADPTQMLSYLQGVSSSVTKVGTDTIRGVSATEYKATIDMDKAAAKASATQRKALDTYKKAVGSSTLPVEVWLDGQGRLVREHESVAMTTGGQKVTTDTTIDLYDYGTPVSIKAPM